ncbi:unnamed protein product [Diatraea saccharalis]|uniref:Uncharacterized protein n=1 Tax=Diatraea saccharalis TaxID=40085 RepID=A0A9N9R5P6_9NEOP|nr:unnamed protein product [Diatraea saccharalis]
MYKTEGETFCPKTTTVDEKVVALLTPQFQPLTNDFDSSATYYEIRGETSTAAESPVKSTRHGVLEDITVDLVAIEEVENIDSTIKCHKQLMSPASLHHIDVNTTPKIKKTTLTETKKKEY